MDYQEWLPLFGLPANDRRVVAALAEHGINTPVTLRPQELTVNVDFKNDGMSAGFTSEYTLRHGVADLPILSSVVMKIILGKTAKNWTVYTGPLPHGLKKTQSKDDVVSLVGEPVNFDADLCSARWVIDGLGLGILFTEDWKSIKQLGLSLPRMT